VTCDKRRPCPAKAKTNCRQVQQFTRNLEQRLESHRHGTACATTKVAFDRGIGFTLARTWDDTPKLEREIKRTGVVNCRPTATLSRPT
jgi:hypothetical protein